eukprot:5361849-Amphidinium_carterae.1
MLKVTQMLMSATLPEGFRQHPQRRTAWVPASSLGATGHAEQSSGDQLLDNQVEVCLDIAVSCTATSKNPGVKVVLERETVASLSTTTTLTLLLMYSLILLMQSGTPNVREDVRVHD